MYIELNQLSKSASFKESDHPYQLIEMNLEI